MNQFQAKQAFLAGYLSKVAVSTIETVNGGAGKNVSTPDQAPAKEVADASRDKAFKEKVSKGQDPGYVGSASGDGMDARSGKPVPSNNPADKVPPKGKIIPLPVSKQDPKLFRQPGYTPPASPYVRATKSK